LKTIIAIFLSLQFLSNNTFVEEALRLPVLFEHFAHHHHEGDHDGEGFLHFLYEHYVDNHDEIPDSHHDNLPFNHSSDDCSNHSHNTLSFITEVVSVQYSDPSNDNPLNIFFEFFLKDQFLSSIWQPPKIA